MTLRNFVAAEEAVPRPTGLFGTATQAGPAALLWITRVLHFIEQLLATLRRDADIKLADAALLSYRSTLRARHSTLTRAIFERAFLYVPNRATFEDRISSNPADVPETYARFLIHVSPHLTVLFDAQHTSTISSTQCDDEDIALPDTTRVVAGAAGASPIA
jgi:hypothetical protein